METTHSQLHLITKWETTFILGLKKLRLLESVLSVCDRSESFRRGCPSASLTLKNTGCVEKKWGRDSCVDLLSAGLWEELLKLYIKKKHEKKKLEQAEESGFNKPLRE